MEEVPNPISPERRGPVLRVLLHVADGEAGDERVGRAGLGDDLAGVEVEDDRLDGLGAGINADEEGHGKELRKRG